MLTTVLTIAALGGLTALLIVRKHRSTSSCAAGSDGCPRCGGEVPSGAVYCPACGVPQQVFEIAAAPVAAETEAKAGAPAEPDRLHAVVRADVCVGCASCVPVCPEAGAIRMAGKLAVIEKDRCTGHGKCAEACPVGGIVLTTGEMVHQVEVPHVERDFQTNVPNVYIVGELGGRGLIKNAINEGKIAAENVGRAVHSSAAPRVPGVLDLVIVGSGPAGLSAGLEARRAGLRFGILEQGTLADSIRKYPRHKLLLAEPLKIPLYGDLWVADASKETLLQVWEAMISRAELPVRTGCRVENIVREAGCLKVTGPGFEVRTRHVILAMGRRGNPRRLGVPGEDRENVFYDIVEMEAFRGRNVLVVGGGDSALESAVGLANQEGTTVTLSYRGTDFDRAKERNVAKLAAAEQAGRLRVVRGSTVRSIESGRVTLETPDGPETIPNDDIVVRIGGESPNKFLAKVGVNVVKKQIPLAQATEGVTP
jgi:thioredoxin reductase